MATDESELAEKIRSAAPLGKTVRDQVDREKRDAYGDQIQVPDVQTSSRRDPADAGALECALSLPYPNGPRPDDGVRESERKIAENLDAIASWAAEVAKLAGAEGLDLLEITAGGAAGMIDRFAEGVR